MLFPLLLHILSLYLEQKIVYLIQSVKYFNAVNRDVIVRMSSVKDSRKVCVQFDTCFTTLSRYLI